jgi:hypothetical protein
MRRPAIPPRHRQGEIDRLSPRSGNPQAIPSTDDGCAVRDPAVSSLAAGTNKASSRIYGFLLHFGDSRALISPAGVRIVVSICGRLGGVPRRRALLEDAQHMR